MIFGWIGAVHRWNEMRGKFFKLWPFFQARKGWKRRPEQGLLEAGHRHEGAEGKGSPDDLGVERPEVHRDVPPSHSFESEERACLVARPHRAHQGKGSMVLLCYRVFATRTAFPSMLLGFEWLRKFLELSQCFNKNFKACGLWHLS